MREEVQAYADIINLPYVKSTRHHHMAVADRAAQFAPFAALTGHEDAVEDTAAQALVRAEFRDVEGEWDV